MINYIAYYDIPTSHFLIFSSALFFIGINGIILNKKSLIHVLFSIELMLLAANLNFLFFGRMLNDVNGQIFSIFILTVAAAETAIGISIIVLFFLNNKDINVTSINKLKG